MGRDRRAVFIEPVITPNYAVAYLERKGFEVKQQVLISQADIRILPESDLALVVMEPFGPDDYSKMALKLVEAFRPQYNSRDLPHIVAWTRVPLDSEDEFGERLRYLKSKGVILTRKADSWMFYGAIDELFPG